MNRTCVKVYFLPSVLNHQLFKAYGQGVTSPLAFDRAHWISCKHTYQSLESDKYRILLLLITDPWVLESAEWEWGVSLPHTALESTVC